jgi:hypothetical protein
MNQHQIGIAKTFAGLPFRTMDARRVGPDDETQVGDAAGADTVVAPPAAQLVSVQSQ